MIQACIGFSKWKSSRRISDRLFVTAKKKSFRPGHYQWHGRVVLSGWLASEYPGVFILLHVVCKWDILGMIARLSCSDVKGQAFYGNITLILHPWLGVWCATKDIMIQRFFEQSICFHYSGVTGYQSSKIINPSLINLALCSARKYIIPRPFLILPPHPSLLQRLHNTQRHKLPIHCRQTAILRNNLTMVQLRRPSPVWRHIPPLSWDFLHTLVELHVRLQRRLRATEVGGLADAGFFRDADEVLVGVKERATERFRVAFVFFQRGECRGWGAWSSVIIADGISSVSGSSISAEYRGVGIGGSIRSVCLEALLSFVIVGFILDKSFLETTLRSLFDIFPHGKERNVRVD